MMAKKNDTPKTFREVLHYIKKYWLLLACSILFAAATVALTLYVPVVTGDAVDLVVAKGLVDFRRFSSCSPGSRSSSRSHHFCNG